MLKSDEKKPAVRYGRIINKIKNELVKKGYDVEYIDIEELPGFLASVLPHYPKYKNGIDFIRDQNSYFCGIYFRLTKDACGFPLVTFEPKEKEITLSLDEIKRFGWNIKSYVNDSDGYAHKKDIDLDVLPLNSKEEFSKTLLPLIDMLKNLLAVIHGDGGQHAETYGLLKSYEDAKEKVSNMIHNEI